MYHGGIYLIGKHLNLAASRVQLMRFSLDLVYVIVRDCANLWISFNVAPFQLGRSEKYLYIAEIYSDRAVVMCEGEWELERRSCGDEKKWPRLCIDCLRKRYLYCMQFSEGDWGSRGIHLHWSILRFCLIRTHAFSCYYFLFITLLSLFNGKPLDDSDPRPVLKKSTTWLFDAFRSLFGVVPKNIFFFSPHESWIIPKSK